MTEELKKPVDDASAPSWLSDLVRKLILILPIMKNAEMDDG